VKHLKRHRIDSNDIDESGRGTQSDNSCEAQRKGKTANDRRIQITDFSPIRLEKGEVKPFSGQEWAPTADVSAFASLLFEIAVRGTVTPAIGAAVGASFPAPVPAFVSRIIEQGRSPKLNGGLWFAKIVAWLEENRFKIMAGVDSDEVSAFVGRVKSFEQSLK
jgi:hypothetical protein